MKQHQEREAWNEAHPEEAARIKATKREALAREQQALVAARQAREARQRVAVAAEAARQARESRESHPCDTADTIERQAADAINSDRYQESYDLAMSGLHYAERCENESDKVINKGYLMSFKAFAEHHLGSGDWRTDFNEANSLLVQCQTTPGIYGTHTAAQCETQEHNNIAATVHWDTGS